MLKILNAILAIFWIVRSILVIIGVDELSTVSAACACLIASLAFFEHAVQDWSDVD